MYFDRWQIEVNHREEKDTIGVGQAQLWNPISVPKCCLSVCLERKGGSFFTIA
jgi:hypothetical protein